MGWCPWAGPCDSGSPSVPGSAAGLGRELTGLLVLPQMQQQQLQRMAQLQLQQQQALQAQPPIQQPPLQQPPPAPSQALPQQLQPPQHHPAPPQPPPQPQPQPLASQAPALPGQMLYAQPQLKLVSSRCPWGCGWQALFQHRDSPWHPCPGPHVPLSEGACVPPAATPVAVPLLPGGTVSSKQPG